MPETPVFICRGETAVCLGGLQLAFIKVYFLSHHCLACVSLLSLSTLSLATRLS